MRAAAAPYAQLQRDDTTCLDREPPLRGSEQWWEWWYECCPKPNPYPRGSVLHQRWIQRVKTNPFKCRSPEWCRWEKGCAAPAPPLWAWLTPGCGACCGMLMLTIAVAMIVIGTTTTAHRNSKFVAPPYAPPPPKPPAPPPPPEAITFTSVSHGCDTAAGAVGHLEHATVTFLTGVAAYSHAAFIPRSVAACPDAVPKSHGGFVDHELRLEVRLPASSATEPYVLCVRPPFEKGPLVRHSDVVLHAHLCPPAPPPSPASPPPSPPPFPPPFPPPPLTPCTWDAACTTFSTDAHGSIEAATEAARLFCAATMDASTSVSDCAVTDDPIECDNGGDARRLSEPALSTVYARVCTYHSPPPPPVSVDAVDFSQPITELNATNYTTNESVAELVVAQLPALEANISALIANVTNVSHTVSVEALWDGFGFVAAERRRMLEDVCIVERVITLHAHVVFNESITGTVVDEAVEKWDGYVTYEYILVPCAPLTTELIEYVPPAPPALPPSEPSPSSPPPSPPPPSPPPSPPPPSPPAPSPPPPPPPPSPPAPAPPPSPPPSPPPPSPPIPMPPPSPPPPSPPPPSPPPSPPPPSPPPPSPPPSPPPPSPPTPSPPPSPPPPSPPAPSPPPPAAALAAGALAAAFAAASEPATQPAAAVAARALAAAFAAAAQPAAGAAAALAAPLAAPALAAAVAAAALAANGGPVPADAQRDRDRVPHGRRAHGDVQPARQPRGGRDGLPGRPAARGAARVRVRAHALL